MTQYMIDFVIISYIIWLRGINHDRWVIKDKKSLNVWRDSFHPTSHKGQLSSSIGQIIYIVEVSCDEWLKYDWQIVDHFISQIYS
jgi:hypothetical protein